MACPFLNDVLDEEVLILRRSFRRERVFRDRSDPLAFVDDYLTERYRFSGDGIRYLCRLLDPKIQHRTKRSHALTVPQMVCVALRFFASGTFLYSVGDAENLNKGTICCTIRTVCLALKSLAHIFITFPGHRRFVQIKEEFYKIAEHVTKGPCIWYGPTSQNFTTAEELALELNKGKPVMEGIQGGTSTDSCTARESGLFIQASGNTVLLLEPPDHDPPEASTSAMVERTSADEETVSLGGLRHQSSTRPLYTQNIFTVLRWSCCKGHGRDDRDDADPDAQLEFEDSDVSGGSDPEKRELRAPEVHVEPRRPELEQNDQHSSRHRDEVNVLSYPEATAALPVHPMMTLVMSQLQPVLEAFNHSLDLLNRQVKALAGDVAELKSSWEEPDLQPGPLDQAAEQHLETRLEEVVKQITNIRTQMENQQTDMENRLHSQHATLHHNVTSFKMDMERHQKDVQVSLQAMNSTLSELKLDQDQDPGQSSEEPPPQQQLSDSAALWEAVERLDNAVVNNTGKVSGLMEDVDVASGDVQRLQRDLTELREQMEQTGRNTQIQYMMTGLEVEDAKVAVLRRVGELAANLTLQDKRLQEMDVDVDYLYTALYRNSSAGDTSALKDSLARLEKALANVTELAHDNRLALDESSKGDVETWSVPAVEALQLGLRQVKDSLVSEQSRSRSLNHSLAQLSGSVTAGLAEVSGLKDTNRELWQKMQHLSTWFEALLTDASRHSEVLDVLLGEEVLEFMQWPRRDQKARSIPALMQQLAEHELKITSLLANKTGGRQEQPSADQPSSSHRPLPGRARERQLLLHPEQGEGGRELQNLEEMVEKMLERLNQEEKPCRCTNTSTAAVPAAVDAALQAEVLWLKRGLEQHLSMFKNVFSNADVLARSNDTLELDQLWELLKSKDRRKDKRRRGENRSRRNSDIPPAGLTDPPVQFVAASPQSTSHSGFAFKWSLNQGRFHPETGSFTAPVDGLYLFILTLDLRPGPVHVVLRRRSGGSPVSLHHAEVVQAGPRTGVGLLLLRGGEEVRLDLRRGVWLENQDNVFTGLLLQRTT